MESAVRTYHVLSAVCAEIQYDPIVNMNSISFVRATQANAEGGLVKVAVAVHWIPRTVPAEASREIPKGCPTVDPRRH